MQNLAPSGELGLKMLQRADVSATMIYTTRSIAAGVVTSPLERL